jgi:hypothetical protein
MVANQDKVFTAMKNRALFCLFLFLFFACRDSPQQVLPDIEPLVDISIVVTNIQYPDLQVDGGFAYLEGGRRGIIVIRQSAGNYLAFDRICTFRPQDTCERVEVHSSRLFLIDDCCGSQFGFDGRPSSGPAAFPLRRYTTQLSGNLLRITN